MEDILQVLQTSWPIFIDGRNLLFFIWRPQKKQQKSALIC